jgi:hypothetical protein
VEIETVEVGPGLDAELSTEGDLQAVERAAQISGVVPGSVPSDLPLFIPSSVVGFGDLPGGRAWVEFDTGREPMVVRSWLGERLPAAGWTIGAVGEEGVQAHKGSRSVGYRLVDLAPGSRIRLEYAPRP